jgi:glycosyltransferase 2 family protein
VIRRLPPALVLGTNLAVGTAVLAWALRRHGGPALALLGAHVEPTWLVLFVAAAVSAFLVYTRRWQLLLRGLGTAPSLASLAAFRAAGHSVSAFVPSAKLGGEPVRAFLLARSGAPGRHAIASVAVDRVLEMGAAAGYGCLYAVFLVRRGVPELEGAMMTVTLGAVALAGAVAITVRRLRAGRGLVTAVASHTGLDRLALVRERMDVLAGAEEDAARLVGEPGRIGRAFALGMLANLVVLVEYGLLLAAFGLPAAPLAVVGAMFAAGAAHSLPIPAAVGALEGAEMWLFGILGHPPEVGLAVALAVRVRELVWTVPGLVVLALGGVRASEWSAR